MCTIFYVLAIFSLHLTDEENKEIFSKCNNPNGHGHNYTGISVSVSSSHLNLLKLPIHYSWALMDLYFLFFLKLKSL